MNVEYRKSVEVWTFTVSQSFDFFFSTSPSPSPFFSLVIFQFPLLSRNDVDVVKIIQSSKCLDDAMSPLLSVQDKNLSFFLFSLESKANKISFFFVIYSFWNYVDLTTRIRAHTQTNKQGHTAHTDRKVLISRKLKWFTTERFFFLRENLKKRRRDNGNKLLQRYLIVDISFYDQQDKAT